jgi:AraC-like DNA-binding protein
LTKPMLPPAKNPAYETQSKVLLKIVKTTVFKWLNWLCMCACQSELYRIEKAKQLLAKGHPVSDVAHQLKYSSTSHFSKVFKAVVGVSPSGYRAI